MMQFVDSETMSGQSDVTFAKRRAVSGVSSAGLTTQVQPAARAAATLRPIMPMGKFHWSEENGWTLACFSMNTDENPSCNQRVDSVYFLWLKCSSRKISHEDVCLAAVTSLKLYSHCARFCYYYFGGEGWRWNSCSLEHVHVWVPETCIPSG